MTDPTPPQPFEFRAATRLVVGAGAVSRLGTLARELGCRRALVVSDPGVVRAGHTALGTTALEKAGLAIDAWCDPSGLTRSLFASAYGFEAFPTTYLIGPDGTIRRVWSGYAGRDEAEMAAAVLEALKACPPPREPTEPSAPVAR